MITCCVCGKEYISADNILVYGCHICRKGNDRGVELTKKLKEYVEPAEPKKAKKKK